MGLILGAGFLGIGVLAHHLLPVVDEGGETVLSQMGKAVFGGDADLLRLPVRDLRHPDPGRQHRVRRLPAALVDHRPGRLPAPPARQPRRPARVLERHPRPVGHGRAADRRLPGRGQRADPALRGGRVHRVHAVPVRHDPPPPARAGARVEAGPRHQLRRLPRHRHRAGRRRGLEVHRGRLDPGGRDPDDRAGLPGHPPALRPRSTPRSRPEPGYKARRRTHTVVVLVGRVHKGVLESIAYARSLQPDRLVAVSVVSNAEEQERITTAWEDFDIPVELRTLYSPYRELQRPIVQVHRRARRGDRRRLRHRRPARVRARPLVGAGAAQPERPAAAGPAAGPAEHHRHVGAVPPRGAARSRWSDPPIDLSVGRVTPHGLAGRARCREPSLQELFP